MGVSAFVMWQLLEKLPDGDPDEVREAARVWRRVADRIDQSSRDMGPVAANVLKDNNAPGFAGYWNEDFAPFPPHASAYIRRLADALDNYAELLWHTQKTIIEMAIISYLEMLMFMLWPEIGAGPIKWAAERLKKRAKAKLLKKILERYATSIVGSAFFAVADQVIVDGVKLSFGQPLDSWGDQFKTMAKNFAACMVFYGVDQKKLKFLSKILPKSEQWNKYGEFMYGSVMFTTAGNLLNDPGAVTDPWHLLPTWQQMIGKFMVGAGQRGEKWSRH
ncbi:WXG100-like domain-containing protein [Nonomuraea sediminis]|uniref:WXG100-like domain-containing protein n=1 Tax=Nonomuraea sediminis TaxID=2835864 RepID=UPI001BDCC2D9|nr:hypothetical protein [Nonomuraea sediminis]